MTDEGAAEALAKENPEEEETANKARKSCPAGAAEEEPGN